ncbi:MAG: hypothetical protein A2W03_08660 [Candidatus Aminicenantes bacterium RBG_16_63_16]|nr:MAG: hypothetical protein A2W03_08660 [Candidatus Aminicenantes bacterium RBG_16_63_16]
MLLGMAFGILGTAAGTAASVGVLRVPLVAVDSRGVAVDVISRDSLEVFVNGRRAEAFSLEKLGLGSSPAEQRTVFLIFDTLSTTHLWLSKARTITERLLDAAEPGIAYILLSLEPGSGLRYVLGPSHDRAEVIRALRGKVVARRAGAGLDLDQHRFAREDGLLVGDPRTEQPRLGVMRTETDPVSRRKTQLDEQKRADLFLASLGTLNAALSGFPGSIKTIYFFSGGIASRTKYEDRSTTDPNAYAEVQTVDSLFLNSLARLADIFRTKGAVVFVINPAGAQIGKDEPGSGENQLQLLAERAGGRYLEGEPETIVRRFNEMESSFYEVVLPADEFGSDPIDIEIKSKDPGLRLIYSHRAFSSRGFDSLSRDEKMRLALDAAEGGDASKMVLRLQTAEILAKSEDNDRVQYRMRLPEIFLDSPLDVFRVWPGKGSRPALLELERVQPQGGELTVSVNKKKGYRARIVIVEPRSTAGLVVN